MNVPQEFIDKTFINLETHEIVWNEEGINQFKEIIKNKYTKEELCHMDIVDTWNCFPTKPGITFYENKEQDLILQEIIHEYSKYKPDFIIFRGHKSVFWKTPELTEKVRFIILNH